MFSKGFFLKKLLYTKRLYFRLLISFLLLVLLIILSTALIFSNMYMGTIYDQLAVDSLNNLERLNSEFENIFTQCTSMNLMLRENNDVSSFLSLSSPDFATIHAADIYLQQVKNLSQYLNSIILYNRAIDFAIPSNNSDITINQFLQNDIKRLSANSKYNMVFSFTTPSESSYPIQSDILSLIFTNYNTKDVHFNNEIIMNFDKKEIEQKLFGRFDGITIVTDNQGRVVFSAYNDPIEMDISNEPYFKKILASNKINGALRIDLNKDNKLITFVRSQESDLYIINIKSFNIISKTAITKRNNFIFICLVILLFFILAGFILSRSIYIPIKKITELFSTSGSGNDNEKLDEIATISKVFEETLVQLKYLEGKTEYNNYRLKEELLRLLLKSNTIPDNISTEFKDFKLSISFSNLILISLKIDNYYQIDGNERIAYESTLCKIIPKLLKNDFVCETAKMFEGEIALFLNFKNTETNDYNTLITAMDNIRTSSTKTLKITLSIGIGGVANSMSECMKAYKKGVDMVNHRFVLGTNKIFSQNYLEEILTKNIYYPKELEDSLTASIRMNNRDSFIESLQGIIDLLKYYPYSEAASILFQIVTVCVRTINQVTSKDNSKYYLNLDEFNNIFSSLQTLNQAKDWLIKVFTEYQQMIEEINQLKNNKHYKMIEKIQDFIKNNYQNINLSVESIADMTGYTPYYCSKIFKDITGLNISDFMRQVRINKARELIGIEATKISDIPIMIGFTNVSHFYTVFKKDVGLTPAAYREHVLNNTDNAE